MSILIGLLIFFVGGFIGVATMCMVQLAGETDRRMEEFSKENRKSDR
ncbi:DUF3789 domain-containing protein [Enterococcus termitis]|nr:DUF3789 domain-containing protein [Enterococcus termitis]OJG94601.1 hypothetical protein RV18_GL003192 [Enterococcus termitis]